MEKQIFSQKVKLVRW